MIQYKDDWYALVMVIFQVHVFTPPSTLTEKNDVDNIALHKNTHHTILKQVGDIVSRFCRINAEKNDNTDNEKVQTDAIIKLKRLLVDMETVGYYVGPRLP